MTCVFSAVLMQYLGLPWNLAAVMVLGIGALEIFGKSRLRTIASNGCRALSLNCAAIQTARRQPVEHLGPCAILSR
jgi:hypothetical protein